MSSYRTTSARASSSCWTAKKAEQKPFGLGGIKAIARHYVKVGEAEFNQLRRICTRLDQTADRYRKKNKERLDQFDDPRL